MIKVMHKKLRRTLHKENNIKDSNYKQAKNKTLSNNAQKVTELVAT